MYPSLICVFLCFCSVWTEGLYAQKQEKDQRTREDVFSSSPLRPYFRLGWNTLLAHPPELSTSVFPSLSYDGGLAWVIPISKYEGFTLAPSVELASRNFRFKEEFTLSSRDGKIYLSPVRDLVEGGLERVESSSYQLRTLCLMGELQYARSIFSGGDMFFIGLGAFVGRLLESRTTFHYESIEGIPVKRTVSQDYYSSKYPYGIQVKLGYAFISIFYRMPLSPLFGPEKGPLGLRTTFSTAGIHIGF
ncbi:MAG: hypothetical protein OXB93_02635 [Cytophagales bacterium]|nr:hypothetical protein [Cytophagales bacterium]